MPPSLSIGVPGGGTERLQPNHWKRDCWSFIFFAAFGSAGTVGAEMMADSSSGIGSLAGTAG